MQQDQLYELDFNNFVEVNPTPQHQFSFEETMLLNWKLKDKAKNGVSQGVDPRATITAAQSYSSPLSSPTNGFPTPISEDLLTNTPENKTTLDPLFPLLDVSPIGQAFKTVGPLCQLQKANQDKTATKLEDHETRRWRQTNRSLSSSTAVSQLVASAFATVDSTIRNKELLESQQEQAPFEPDPGFKLRKVAHNAIERRYRNNINDRIRDLKSAVPALYMARVKKDKRSTVKKKGKDIQETSSSEEDSDAENLEDDSSYESKKQRNKQDTIGEVIEGVEVARKLNKATILQKATEYIHYLKHTIALAERESHILQHIIAQMPDGSKFLSSFQTQKIEFQQAEQERLMNERKANIEKERQLRERMLRERAAERAALARVLPKRERRPYHRKSKQELEEKRRQEKLLKKKIKSEKQD